MNTADYCAEGRELYEEFLAWKDYHDTGGSQLVRTELVTRDAYRRFRAHVDKCKQCKGVE